jgi:hypothetical protein
LKARGLPAAGKFGGCLRLANAGFPEVQKVLVVYGFSFRKLESNSRF